MGRKTRIALVSIAALAVVLAAAWSWLTARDAVPAESSYRIDLGALRALAASLPGPGPREIRSALVAEVALPRGVIFAGEPFRPHRQVHQVFQLVDQITNLHYRPRIVTLLIGEDRAQVMDQLRALHNLAAAEPGLVQIVSHDASQRSKLLTSGVLIEGLVE